MHPRVNICLSDCSPWDDPPPKLSSPSAMSPFPKIPLPREAHTELRTWISHERYDPIGKLETAFLRARCNCRNFLTLSWYWHFYLLFWILSLFVSISWSRLDLQKILHHYVRLFREYSFCFCLWCGKSTNKSDTNKLLSETIKNDLTMVTRSISVYPYFPMKCFLSDPIFHFLWSYEDTTKRYEI